MKISNALDYFGKRVKIDDIYSHQWIGFVSGYDAPGDSDDGKWWLDIDVENVNDFRTITISEDEINKIEIIGQ